MEQINFNKFRRDLQTLMEEVDSRLALKKQQEATMDTKAHCDDYCTHTNQAEVTERAFNYGMAEAKKTGSMSFFLEILAARIWDAIPTVQAEEAKKQMPGRGRDVSGYEPRRRRVQQADPDDV